MPELWELNTSRLLIATESTNGGCQKLGGKRDAGSFCSVSITFKPHRVNTCFGSVIGHSTYRQQQGIVMLDA